MRKNECSRSVLMDNIENVDIELLKKISKEFQVLESLYVGLSDEKKEIILNMHNESYSLPFCIRWGAQAIQDILE